jgi:hypothetical protein
MGCLSDHPDVQLYFEAHQSSGELPVLRCARGSSQQEGFHFHVFQSTAGKTVSPDLFDPLLCELVYRWNFDRAVASGLQEDCGCYDIMLFESLNALAQGPIFNEFRKVLKYVPIVIDERPLEKFGCRKVINELSGAIVEEEEDHAFLDVQDDYMDPEGNDVPDDVLDNAANDFVSAQEEVLFQQADINEPVHIAADPDLKLKIAKRPNPQAVRSLCMIT